MKERRKRQVVLRDDEKRMRWVIKKEGVTMLSRKRQEKKVWNKVEKEVFCEV